MKISSIKFIFLALTILIQQAICDPITCPIFKCISYNAPPEEHLPNNVCFQHDGELPVQEIKGEDCQYWSDNLPVW
jgi:hypothetical protein